jgi:hypothetical protein
MSKIVELYVRKIRAGEMTIDDVPARWREAVRKELEGE